MRKGSKVRALAIFVAVTNTLVGSNAGLGGEVTHR